MKALIQRVHSAEIRDQTNSNRLLESIECGFLMLVGFEAGDTEESLKSMGQKILNLRVFSDKTGKMNLAAGEVSASFLIVSQFTLLADCRKGNRPSFNKAAPRKEATQLYENFVSFFRELSAPLTVKNGPFGADLDVTLSNNGPVTLWLDSKDLQ